MRILFSLVAALGVAASVGCTTPRPTRDDVAVRVTELHFKPSVEQGSAEYIEIANLGEEPLDLSGWFVTGAGRVELPQGTVVKPGACIVLCQHKDSVEKLTKGAVDAPVTFEGKLRAKGETVRVEDPTGAVADEVTYNKDYPEVGKASGTGLSIHRADLDAAFGNEAWRAAKPTPGAAP